MILSDREIWMEIGSNRLAIIPEGQLRLEISHNGPYDCILRPGQKICQLIIERLGSPAQTSLESMFQRQRQNPG